ncbi:MAG: hypothetical protein JNL08_15480 [Planctomycetes bacterium]|nr:hypothetical protein [Planctomycetota bacterium]
MHDPSIEPDDARALPWWAAAAAMVGLVLVAYLPAALRAQFLNFDDPFFFGPQNPEFTAGLGAVLDPSRPIANAWLPVAHASLWFDWWLGGGRPLLPHLSSLLLHALAATVLVRLCFALTARRGLSLAVGAVFAVHPALAESVAWVSGRKDVLSGLFVFAALLLTVRQGERPRAWRLAAIALCGALAMYAKATAVVAPLLALLCCVAAGRARQRWLAPAVLLLVTVPIAWHHQTVAAAEGTLAGGAPSERLLQVPGAFWHYTATTLWPVRLNVLYPEVDTLARFRALLVPGGLALAAVAALLLLAWWRPRWRAAAAGAVAFVLALLPFNTAFPASSIAAADRYLYLAVPGAALALFAALQQVAPRGLPWGAAALLLPLLWWCGGRAHDFGDSETLWRQSLAVEPVNAVAQLNLVSDLLQRGPTAADELQRPLLAAVAAARYPIHELRARLLLVRIGLAGADYAAAAEHARAAIAAAERQLAAEVAPRRRAEAQVWLLQACLAAFEPLQKAGDTAGGEAAWERARTLVPAHPDVVAFAQLRELSLALGVPPRPLADDDPRGAAADAALAAARDAAPEHAGLWCTQAAWHAARGRVLPALHAYRRAFAADPDCIDAWLGAARLLRERDNCADAETYARRGLERRPDPALRQELALALVGQGRLDDAILHLEACLRLRPDADTAKVLANVLIGRAYERLSTRDGDRTEVLRLVERALQCNPNEAKAHLVLGRLAREQRQFATAVQHLEIAHRLLPDFADARHLLAQSLADLGLERVLAHDDEAAGTAFRRCLDIAPPDFVTDGARLQLTAIWRRSEARGVECLRTGDRAGAEAAFRRCLQLEPDQHWAAWLLATTLHERADADLAELERLCRQAVAWQRQNGLDRSQQVYLLAATLARAGNADAARAAARELLADADAAAAAPPAVRAALQRFAAD